MLDNKAIEAALALEYRTAVIASGKPHSRPMPALPGIPEKARWCYRRFARLQEKGIIERWRTIYRYTFEVTGRQVYRLNDLNHAELNALRKQLRAPERPYERVKACEMRFYRLLHGAIIPENLTIYDYAFQVIGRPVNSLSDLSHTELETLCERLEGKTPKIVNALQARAKALGIRDLAAWLLERARQKGFFYLKGHTLETLPYSLVKRLTESLDEWEATEQERERIADRGAPLLRLKGVDHAILSRP